MHAEGRASLKQVAQDKTQPGRTLRGEKDPQGFLYYSACCKKVGHDLDQSDRQELSADL